MTELEALLRAGVPPLLAVAAAWFVDARTRRRGLDPPGFARPGRRLAAVLLLALVFWIGVFGPLGELGQQREPDLAKLRTYELFLLHAVLVFTVGAWYTLGFAGLGSPLAGAWSPRVQLGLRAGSVPRELGLGLGLGVAIWGVVVLVLLVIGAALFFAGRQDVLPQKPPALVPWLAAQPWAVRLLVSLSAGFVEEVFFRGFLQPRVGIALSSVLFILAHVAYGEPFMLVGVTLLSLIYALVVRWRQNVWPAVAAHALFDAVQLLVLIPLVLRTMEQGGAAAGALALLP